MIALINALLFWILFLKYYTRYKRIDIYMILIFVYTITATFCAVTYYTEPQKWPNLSLFGFVYMYIIFYIMSRPFRGFNLHVEKLQISENKLTKSLIYIYIVSAIIVVTTSYQDVVDLFQANAWNSVRQEVYSNEGEVILYSSIYQRLAKNFCGYLGPLVIVYAFYMLTKQNLNKWFSILLFSSIIIPSFMNATVVASRGMIMGLVIKLFLGYLLFRNLIPKTRKKYIYAIALTTLLLLSTYIIAVSISRFGDSEYKSSMMFYFGHSMLSFSQNLFGKLHDYLYGEYFFYWFLHDNGNVTSIDLATLGSQHGSSFITFVGPLYADFGLIGALLFSFISCGFFSVFSRRKYLRLSDLVMLFFYMSYLANGIFCPGTSGALRLLMILIVFFLVRIAEKK